MHVLAAVAALMATVSAQSLTASSVSSAQATTTANASSTTTGQVTHTVAVGKGGHTMSPDVTLAKVGDIIEFQFYPTNHSVIRAAYGYPCVPYEMVEGAGYYGFWSGWEPVDAVLDDPPKYQVRVNDTDPIFYYCGAPNSCIGYQMVGVINPNANTSLARQKQLAGESTFVLVPGEDWPNEGSIPSGVATTSKASATPTPTVAPATSTPTPTAVASSTSSHSLGAGAIAGIAIGGSAVLLAAGIAIWFCGRQSRRDHMPVPTAAAQEVHGPFSPATGSMYGKPGHMSTVSGYGMPPVYEHQSIRSPSVRTPVDPIMGQQVPYGAPSPLPQHLVPAHGTGNTANMYQVGMHRVGLVEMEGGHAAEDSSRRSTEKPGVERYS